MPTMQIPLLRGGAFLDLGVGASKTFTSATNRPKTWKALIDTGASITAISPSIVATLKPHPLSDILVTRPGGGRVYHSTYDVRVRFGGHAHPGQWFFLEAVEAQPATPNVDILIGMDLLFKIDMFWMGSLNLVQLNY